MKLLRDAAAGTGCILVLVALGFWYADSPCGQSTEANPNSAPTSIRRVEWSDDGRALLSLADSGVARLFLSDAFEAGSRLEFGDIEYPAAAALSPGARHALVGTWFGQLLKIDSQSIETKCILRLPPREMSAITRVALCPDGRLAAAAASDGRIFLCNPDAEWPPLVIPGCRSAATDMRFSPDARRLVIARGNGRVSVWDAAEGRYECEFQAHEGRAIAAACLPDEQSLITAGQDNLIRLWDLAAAREIWQVQLEPGSSNAFDVSRDGRTAACGGFDHRIVIFDLERRCATREIAIEAAVFQLKFSPDGGRLAAAGTGGTIRLFDPATGVERRQVRVDLEP